MTHGELKVLASWVHNHNLHEILNGLADVCRTNATEIDKRKYPCAAQAARWRTQAVKLEDAAYHLAATP